jgi:Transposase zinc-ribbon domain
LAPPRSDEEAEQVFVRLRWSDNNGEPFCPHCGCAIVYSCRRPNGVPRWCCRACRKDFSVTISTLFAFHKLSLRSYLMAIADTDPPRVDPLRRLSCAPLCVLALVGLKMWLNWVWARSPF